jgi:hypothetical protein|tara:strand:+ start:861 stop:989 length:129 start_codon:yes stop_codon:yes gene_type:complete
MEKVTVYLAGALIPTLRKISVSDIFGLARVRIIFENSNLEKN